MTTYRDRHLAGEYQAEDAGNGATVAELKEQLRALNKPIYGTKAQLSERLEKALAEPVPEEVADDS